MFDELAVIIEGFEAGSTNVKVQAVQSDATIVLVFDALYNQLGSVALNDNIGIVALNRSLIENEPIYACVGTFGQKVGGVVIVLGTGAKPTGWLLPETVEIGENTMTASEYTETTGIQLPAVYAPESFNHTPVNPVSGIEQLTGIGFDLIEKISDGTVILTVDNVQNCSQGYSIKFDADAASNVHSKTYTTDGIKTIRVIDANNVARFFEREYSITVPVAPVPSSVISNAGYNFRWEGALLIITIIAASTDPALEMKIDGLTVGPYVDMNFIGSKRYSREYGVPSGAGTYNVEVRDKTNIGDFKTFQAVLT
ncbi:hypothetical protein [Runella sp.]|uniref:hypothetical protein n=1 Tax=Runella sp. TaxID=1960881 RepID=UPI003D143CC9